MSQNINSLYKLAHHIFINHNPIDGKKLVSYGHRGDRWAKVNYETGSKSVTSLKAHGIVGILADWFLCFQDQENKAVSITTNILNGISDAAFGYRDEKMYSKIYAMGADEISNGTLDNNDLKDQNKILQKAPFIDDFLEMEHFFKDRVLSKFWNWTLKVARVEAPLYFASGFFGNTCRSVIHSLTQTVSRGLWRLSYFFPQALHNNFVETTRDLFKLKMKSFISQNGKKEYETHTKKVEKMASDYAELVYKNEGNSKLKNKTGVSAYLWMLKDRIHQHWRAIKEPEKILNEKIQNGQFFKTTEEERKFDPNKSFDNGYVDPSSEEDKEEQKRRALVDFSSPICGTFGLIGTFIFEPIRCLMDITGIEKGKGFVSFVSYARGPFSLFNYYYKFFKPEGEAGLKYKVYENKYMNKKEETNEAIKMLHKAAKGRYLNSILGKSLYAGSIIDTFTQLFRKSIDESRTLKFFSNTLSRFVNWGFVTYFSARRRDLGATTLVYSAAEKLTGKENITEDDIASIPKAKNKEFLEIINSLGKSTEEPGEEEESIPDRIVSYIKKKKDKAAVIFTS